MPGDDVTDQQLAIAVGRLEVKADQQLAMTGALQAQLKELQDVLHNLVTRVAVVEQRQNEADDDMSRLRAEQVQLRQEFEDRKSVTSLPNLLNAAAAAATVAAMIVGVIVYLVSHH